MLINIHLFENNWL